MTIQRQQKIERQKQQAIWLALRGGVNPQPAHNECELNEPPRKKQKVADSAFQSDVDDLRKENNEIRLKLGKLEDSEKKLSLYEGHASALKTLTFDELDVLETKLLSAMTRIQSARQEMVENKLCCIVCFENPKNVVLQACGHLDLCQECHAKLSSKVCPRCQAPFDRVTVVKHS